MLRSCIGYPARSFPHPKSCSGTLKQYKDHLTSRLGPCRQGARKKVENMPLTQGFYDGKLPFGSRAESYTVMTQREIHPRLSLVYSMWLQSSDDNTSVQGLAVQHQQDLLWRSVHLCCGCWGQGILGLCRRSSSDWSLCLRGLMPRTSRPGVILHCLDRLGANCKPVNSYHM